MLNYLLHGVLTWDEYEGAEDYRFSIGNGGGSTHQQTTLNLHEVAGLYGIELGETANFILRAVVVIDDRYVDITNEYKGTYTYTDQVLGDLDGSGEIDIIDVRLLLQTYINSGSSEWTPEDLATMDMNDDDEVDIIDVRLLLQAYINS